MKTFDRMDKPYALIIEDERDISALFRHVLDMDGFWTEIALHGQTAVEILSHRVPDLILLDLNLPGVPGDKILEIIRKDKRLVNSKVIVTTAHSEIAAGLSAEADLILLKPVSVEQFSDLVKRLYLTIKGGKTIPIQEKPWDPVTGLYNEFFFLNRVKFSLKHAEEAAQYYFSIISVKLNENEGGNNHADTQGWLAVLRETAETLKTFVRPTDTLARFDQGDFYILIENVPNSLIPRQIAARIHSGLKMHLASLKGEAQYQVRIGLILCDRKYTNVEMVLHDVNAANSLANSEGEFFYNDPEKPHRAINPAAG